jgi:acetyl esterase/lipase
MINGAGQYEETMPNRNAKKILAIIREENARKAESIGEVRERLKIFYSQFRSKIDLTVDPFLMGNIPAFWISTSDASKDHAILFFHGGGFMVGSTDDHLDLCGKLSYSTGCRVLSIDYRLSPEHIFPSALNDCAASYLWLIRTGLNPSLIVPIGISAGGNLVLSLLQKLRAMDIPLPKGAVCISPAVDLTSRESVFEKNADKDWLLKDSFELMRKVYLRGHDPKDPLVSPIYGNLNNFPSLFIQVGTHEILFEDVSAFYKKAKESDVDASFDAWKGMFHCWQIFSSVLPEGQQAIDNIGAYIKRVLQTK